MQELLKRPSTGTAPNLSDYSRERGSFEWKDTLYEITGQYDPQEGMNIAHAAVDRHAKSKLAGKTALRFIRKDKSVHEYSYADIMDLSNRFANLLKKFDIREGDAVFSMMPKSFEIFAVIFGTLKNKSVFCPLFSAFGPQPAMQRMNRGEAKVIVTTAEIFEKKIRPVWSQVPSLEHIFIIDTQTDIEKGVYSFHRHLSECSGTFDIPPTDFNTPALMHFTSGTTGMPKGAVHVHKAMLMHYLTGKYVLDFHKDDIFWCTADPGWVTGTSYGILSPLLHGITNVIDEAEYDSLRWYQNLEREKITLWYTSPTAIRRLMQSGIDPLENRFDLTELRWIYSVGEPLPPEAVRWGKQKFGKPILDNWWQTETGGIMISNYPAIKVKEGSMGKPLPGIEAGIVQASDGEVKEITEVNEPGELAIKKGWPSMFITYLHEESKYKSSFKGEWYLTGDLARKDEDGYYWFIGRKDDMIKTAGHMVGPFEVESTLLEHEAVADAAVIGMPDRLIGEIVKAYVVVAKGYEPDEKLKKEIIGFARKNLGSAVAPKKVEFRKSLPTTKSGKIMRRLLKAEELGLPEGDISTLEKD